MTDIPQAEIDERGVARKYGIRELVYPDSEQVKVLSQFLTEAVDSGKLGPVPKTAVLVTLEFLQGTLNRQNITKGPRMSQEEFDILQTPYYLAARIVSKIARERPAEAKKGKLYQTTYLTVNQFIDVLRTLLDPASVWLRTRAVPEDVREVMAALRDFARAYPDQRRKGRAM
jgi:hypothetical protein